MTFEPPPDSTIDLTRGVPAHPIRINGNGAPSATMSAADDGLGGVGWFPSYDRVTVERYLGRLDAERARLEGEIEAADRRTAVARAAIAARTAELEAGLGAVVLAARAEVDRIEQEQAAAVAAIRAEADAEAARIRETARLEAAAVQQAAASLSALVRPRADGVDPLDPYRTFGQPAPTWPPTQGQTDAG